MSAYDRTSFYLCLYVIVHITTILQEIPINSNGNFWEISQKFSTPSLHCVWPLTLLVLLLGFDLRRGQ